MKEGSRRRNNRGFTFVELLCAIAIFGCISLVIGGVMVVTANTYYGGTAETNLQQEAEQTANMIESLIVDATYSINYFYYDVSAGAYEDVDSEAQALAEASAEDVERKLEIVNADPSVPGSGMVYNVHYNQISQEIKYSEGSGGTQYLLADNVTRFGVDVTDFAANHNVVLDIGMEDNGKQYDMIYNVTARNNNVSDVTYTESKWLAINPLYTTVVLEPGQTFTLPVTVTGTEDNKNYTFALSAKTSDDTEVNKIGDSLVIEIGQDELGMSGSRMLTITLASQAVSADGVNKMATKMVFIKLRKADAINAVLTQDNPLTQGPHDEDTTYTVTANVSGTNFGQVPHAAYDDSANYRNPHYVAWDYTLYDEHGTELAVADYFTFTDNGESDHPSLGIKLEQDMPVESQLVITAKSKHAAVGSIGATKYNKSGVAYDTGVKTTVILDGPERPTAEISVANEIILEPGQTEFFLPVTVTATPGYTDVDYILEGKNSTGTGINPQTGGVKISLGVDETGSGTYEFKLKIKSQYTEGGSPLDSEEVRVKVRKVENISLALAQVDENQERYAAGTDYLVAATLTGHNLAQGDSLYDSDYKNPYYVKWDYVLHDKHGTVLAVDDYFTFTDGGESNNPYLGIELAQDMPEESRLTITGTSKHAAIGGTYNKSGIAYNTTVVASAILEGPEETEPPIPTYEVDGSLFRRGQDYIFENIYLDTGLRDSTKKDDGNAQIRWFWRYREILGTDSYGAWSEYRMTGEQGSAKKINAAETYCLAPDKAYEVEYIYAVYSTSGDGSTGVLYWPYNTDLFAAGTGFEGYTRGWDAGETPTSAATYTTRYRIGETAIRFYENAAHGVVAGATSIGSAASPLAFNTSTWFEVSMYTANMEFGHFQSAITWRMEKYNESTGVWEATSASGFDAELIGKALIKGIQSTASGKYRLKCYMTNFNKVKMAGTVAVPSYVADTSSSYNLYDEATGEGIIYFKIN